MNKHLYDINYDLDKNDMKSAIESFPDQIEESFKLFKNWDFQFTYSNINKILVLGMGGSAIGGDVAKVISQDVCVFPIIVNRSYTVPNWVDSNTLVIASSYSGNTEETLSAFKQCLSKKYPIIILSTGGKISDYAFQYNLDRIEIPSGYQPRAALGFSFTLISLLLNKLGYINDNTILCIKESIKSIKSFASNGDTQNRANKIAKQIHNTCPVIYGSEDLTWVVALRFRSQLAENAKMLSFHNHYPEQNHNEIEGWTVNTNIMKKMSIIWIVDEEEHKRNQLRISVSSKLINSYSDTNLTIYQDGKNKIERLLKLIYFTDYISYYAALFNKVDPTPVSRIETLKLEMSKTK